MGAMTTTIRTFRRKERATPDVVRGGTGETYLCRDCVDPRVDIFAENGW